ncbi:unnamed protein product [Calicophoron daubneyi]|uniref:Uncharacterized protein n=1 Tax=Calicophoron daubneyi TaxID=300641 RepID=A0AAV2T4B9_CALDB
MSNPFYLFLALTVLFRLASGHTILSHPELLNPHEAICLEDICEDLSLMEFGLCEDHVILDENLPREMKTIRFERIMEAVAKAQKRLNATVESVLMALLLSEEENIQGLTLINSPEYLIDATPVPGRHVLFPLYHQRYVQFERNHNKTGRDDKPQPKENATEHPETRFYEMEGDDDWLNGKKLVSKENIWFFYLLLARDYRGIPLSCDDPPTKFNTNWILAGECSVLGAVKYHVDETNAPWNIKDSDKPPDIQ